MAKTASHMATVGSTISDFSLYDVISGKPQTLAELKSNHATVVMFICNHCPYVIHIQNELVKLTNEYAAKGVSFIAISSNDVEQYPDDGPEKMKEHAANYKFNFPYLYDQTQAVAKLFNAACTPDFYVLDKNLVCVYNGRFDAATPGNSTAITGNDLRNALDAFLTRKPIDNQLPSLGCNIKWK